MLAKTSGFPFLKRPARAHKPRTRGVTVALDWARSINDAESYVETVGDIVDHMKLTDHIGLMFRYSPDYIKRKNAIYAKGRHRHAAGRRCVRNGRRAGEGAGIDGAH
jgi:phosphosulfolactate synthase (CoM biosynthesis protein A)